MWREENVVGKLIKFPLVQWYDFISDYFRPRSESLKKDPCEYNIWMFTDYFIYLSHAWSHVIAFEKNVLSSLRVRASFKYLWHWPTLRTRYPSLFSLVSNIAENISHHLNRYVRWQSKPKWILVVHEQCNWKKYRMRDLSSL